MIEGENIQMRAFLYWQNDNALISPRGCNSSVRICTITCRWFISLFLCQNSFLTSLKIQKLNDRYEWSKISTFWKRSAYFKGSKMKMFAFRQNLFCSSSFVTTLIEIIMLNVQINKVTKLMFTAKPIKCLITAIIQWHC